MTDLLGGSAHVIRANARRLPLADDSIDLIVTSPPYWKLRAYQDGVCSHCGQGMPYPSGGHRTPQFATVGKSLHTMRKNVQVKAA